MRKELNKYLDDFGMTQPVRFRERPMDMKALRVIAFVQKDKTKEIVQAAQMEVEGQTSGGR